MKIKFIYNKNLKLSPNKVAAQIAHVSANLCRQNTLIFDGYANPETVTHIVLGVSKKKFDEKFEELMESRDVIWYHTIDQGYTEVPEGTITAIGWLENE